MKLRRRRKEANHQVAKLTTLIFVKLSFLSRVVSHPVSFFLSRAGRGWILVWSFDKNIMAFSGFPWTQFVSDRRLI